MPPAHFLTYLATHAERQPDKVALRISNGGGGADEFDEITYAQLHLRVLCLSDTLHPLAAPGERALILMPSGEDFVVAFLACLHAGIIAVPAYPPRRNRNRDRVLSIHDDAQPALILTTAAAEKNVREALPETKARVIAVAGGIDPGSSSTGPGRRATAPAYSEAFIPAHNSDRIAFLQYTSGSTGTPKGTVITHASLLANLDAIQSLFQHEPEHEVITWLPPYHDMGLIGCVITPLFRGMTFTLLTADEFLRQPVRWLQVISSRQAQVSSGAPNFAYQLLAERVTDADLATLDLSRWRIAFNGAEPVQATTLEKFAERFAPCGFSAEAWLPCYGLAETTLLATGKRDGAEDRRPRLSGLTGFQPIEASPQKAESLVPLSGGTPDLHGIISCGPPALDTHITIHHRETGALLEDGEVGEIHVHSPSVALGYWNNPTATAAAFPQPGTLRTGDLGFLRAGELHVTGRVKDLIIIRGRNLYPHDIEKCVEALLPTATGANSIAAFEFSGNGSGSGALGVLIEAPRAWVASVRKQDGEITSHVRRIREAVAETFEITADLIAFVAPGDFPRTSSGKVQRAASRDGVLNGTLPVIHRDQLSAAESTTSEGDESGGRALGPPSAATGHKTSQSIPQNQSPSAFNDGGLRTAESPRQTKSIRPTHPMPQSCATADALIQWLRSFAARRLNSQLMDERRTVAPHVVLEFGNHGLFGLEVPRALGGLGLSTSDSYRVMEQLAAIDLTLALLVGIHNALGLHPILRHGLPTLREELIPAMAGGRHLASFAITELSAGSHPKSIETTAVRGSDGGWTIHGRKQWIGSGSYASTITVIAKARDASGEHLGSVALAVPADAEGLSYGAEAITMGMRASVQVPIILDGVKVDASRVLGEVGRGFEVAYDAMRLARVGLAALSLGAMKRCLQWMTSYATEREVAGGRLADLPATQARLAETVNAIAAAEALVRVVGDWLETGATLPEEVFLICKTTAPELLGETANRAMQMLGARGYMENNGLPQLFRDARLLRIFEGPTEALNASLGARLRRGGDALVAWMETMQGGERAAMIRGLAVEHPTANDVALGELASLQFLLWIVRQSGDGEASAWLEERFRQRSAAANVAAGSVVVSDITARLKHEIGAFDQSLPGEDRELDALLRNTPRSSDILVAATKPTATGMSPLLGLHAAPDILPALELGLLDFLRREKLGNLDAVSHDATFSSLGIDSLGAASLAIEIEKTFGVKITDETLYDYPTLQRLAGYIESRRAPEGTPAEQGRAVWLRDLSAMNERVSRAKEAGNFMYGIPFEGQDGASVVLGGERCVHLSSYGYLGLMADKQLQNKVQMFMETCGAGSHGSRLLANTRWHQELEQRIATALQAEAAITFGTGFSTNWAVISTLMQPQDTIFADEWVHASLVDGCRTSGAAFHSFRHNNVEHLAELLTATSRGKTLIVADAVYSMEGDIARIPEISALAHAHGAWLMVDEAHSLGVLGARGLGIQEHFSLPPDAIDIKMGTLSKAIPSSGGYIAGCSELISALRHNARSYIFGSASTPPQVAAAIAGLDILLTQPERVETLHDNIRFYLDGLSRIGLKPPETGTAIIPLMCHDELSAFSFAKRCRESGLYVTPIVFPAVPQNAPRIRTSITAALSREDITFALEVIARHAPGLLAEI